ncbi:MAG: SMP-30/gluconolactonase/LRE family protein [Pedobacter sp.]|nr:MAG: SMP-30/gluconolactonase/LRE family protein [Pedobacter sp.]
MRVRVFFILFCLIWRAQSKAQDLPLFEQANLRLVSSQFSFTEGASVDKDGNVFFTDQPNDQIWKFSRGGELSLFMSNSGRSNGTIFDKDGNLIVCADENNQIWSIDVRGKKKLVYKNPPEKNLNGPNDLWIDARGGIYFTDPYYQRSYWNRKAPNIEGEHVYYLPKGKRKTITVDEDLMRPNGIVGTPDGKILYVADALANRVYQYDIEASGNLVNRKLLIPQKSDGMCLDELGNIYLTGKNGVDIYSKEGKHFANIKIPEPHTANLCFSGVNRDILFITASKSVYTLKMNVKGVE